MNNWIVPIIAFLFGLFALAVVVLILYVFRKMEEEDVLDLMNDV